MIGGIDLSPWNGDPRWDLVASDPKVGFVYLKANEGTDYEDGGWYARHHDSAKQHGLAVGAYHFYHFGQDPQAQAARFLASIRDREGSLLPMVDVEAGGRDGVYTTSACIESLAEFNRQVEQALGCQVLIYCNYADWGEILGNTDAFAGHPFWLAEYNLDSEPTLPTGFASWTVWQYADSGQVPGIGTAVDLDRCPDLRRILRAPA